MNEPRAGEETELAREEKGTEYELQIKKVLQMEREVKENSQSWKEMDKELKEIKALLRDLSGRETGVRESPEHLVQKVEKMSDQIGELKAEIDSLRQTNDKVMNENKTLKQRLAVSEVRGREQGEDLAKLKQEQVGWAKTQKENIVDFKEVIKQQEEEHKNNLEKQVIQVLKRKENMVRDMVEKKQCVIVFGLKEKVLPSRNERVKDEMKVARDIISEVGDDNMELDEEIEEVYRLGKYEEGRARPMKIKLRTQAAVMKVLGRTWKLAQTEEFKRVWIREDLNEDQRAKRNEAIQEAREKNDQRSEEEKSRFFWRVLDGKVRKWFTKGEQV